MKAFFLPALVAAFTLSTSLAMAAPKVVATIKPVHSLVASVMAGVGEPYLVVKGASSPHTYALKPSDAGAIEAADIIFWTGHGMELFLADKVGVLAPNAVSVPLSEASGIALLGPREGGMFEGHDEAAEEGHNHDEEEADMHMFLDPQNAQIMVTSIAETLSKADPENAALYAANAEKTRAGLVALEAEIATALAPVKDKPFVVFHDAYQYFEKRFGLNVAGSITVSPEVAPGAERIAEIHDKLKTLSAACVFAEPQFEPAIVDVLIEGTPAKKGVLDPEGADIPEGVDMYASLLRNLATNLTGCLGS
jgi:zinc transport system substrate-binding protein